MVGVSSVTLGGVNREMTFGWAKEFSNKESEMLGAAESICLMALLGARNKDN